MMGGTVRPTRVVDPHTHAMLVDWARWCRGSYLPTEFHVICQSIESSHLPEAGEVLMSMEERLQARKPAYNDARAEICEHTVCHLPEQQKTALRLHYVVWRAMPLRQKRRILGVTEDAYWDLIDSAALEVRKILTD